MDIYITRSGRNSAENNLQHSVIAELSQVCGPVKFKSLERTYPFSESQNTNVPWSTIFSQFKRIRNDCGISSSDIVILLMEESNENNYFSACDPDGSNNIFIHTDEWDKYIQCDRVYPVAHQVIENIIEILMTRGTLSIEDIAHDSPIGCINDMCWNKEDIRFKLRTGDICSKCQDILYQNKVTPSVIDQLYCLIGKLRANMIEMHIHSNSEYTTPFPFPIAIRKRILTQSLQSREGFFYMLDYFDSLVRCTVIVCGKMLPPSISDVFFAEQELNEKPSLGHWVAALKKLQKDPYRKELSSLESFFPNLEKLSKEVDQKEIVRLRNENYGHSYTRTDNNEYQTLLNKYLPVIQEIENYLLPLYHSIQMHYIRSMDQPHPGKYILQTDDLTGDHPVFSEKEISYTSDSCSPLTKQVSIYSSDGQWYSLDPFIQYTKCPMCDNKERVLIANGVKFLNPYRGHIVKLQEK